METRETYEARREEVSRLMTADPRLFDMTYFANSRNKCGTTHCIAGWTWVAMSGGREMGLGDEWPTLEQTEAYLGIPRGLGAGMNALTAGDSDPLFYRFHIASAEDGVLALKGMPYV